MSVQSIEDQLTQLRQEVAVLEEDLYYRTHRPPDIDHKKLDNVIKYLLKSKTKDGISDKADQQLKEIKHLEVQMDLLSTLTGLHINNTSSKLNQIDPTRTEREYKIEGSCYDRSFSLTLIVTEKKVSQIQNNAKITSLKISLDKIARQELKDYLYSFEENNDIQGFLQFFTTYAECRHNRQCTFGHFQEKYPDFVMCPDGENGTVMKIFHGQKPGAIWLIDWQLVFELDGNVCPDLQLTVKSPKAMLAMDKRNILKMAPEKFTKMMQQFGISQAIDTIIQIVAE